MCWLLDIHNRHKPISLSCLFFLLSFLSLLSFTHAQTLSFGKITTCNCKSTPINYSLTIFAWLTPNTSFVIVVRAPGKGSGLYPVTASIDTGQSWSVLEDSQQTDTGELWIPVQAYGTEVTVIVDCDDSTVYTLEPVIPAEIGTSQDAPNFAYSAISDAFIFNSSISPVHAHWFIVPNTVSIGYLWSELCQVPGVSDYLFKMRVVFPGNNVTGDSCIIPKTNTYSLSGGTNFRAYSDVGTKISWSNVQSSVFYVLVYATNKNSIPVPIDYRVILTNPEASVQYYAPAIEMFTGHATQIDNDLYIGLYFPPDTSAMSLYFLGESSSNLDPKFFASACYLIKQAYTAKFLDGLKNGSQDNQMSLSSVGLVKAENFFLGKGKISTGTFAITYNQDVVLSNINGFTTIATTKSNLVNGVVIGLSVIIGVLSIIIGLVSWKYWKLRMINQTYITLQ